MIYKIAFIITLLSLTTTISARSLEGYKCKDHTVLSDDPFTPLRTVRICGVVDYPNAATNYYQTLADIPDKVYPSAPTNAYFNRRYISSGVWPSQSQSFQRTSSPAFVKRWPVQPEQTESNESEKILLNLFKNMQPLNEPKYAETATDYPSNTDSALNTDKLMELQHFNEQSVNSIAEDATAMKNSVTDVVSHMKNMLDILLLTKAPQAEESDININVNFKLDPSFQTLLHDFLQLAKANMDSNKNVEADESTESVIEDNNNDENEDYDIATTTDYSEESVSQEQTESEESSNENVDKEDSEAKSSSEDFDTWFRIHFGPAVKLHHTEEDTENDNSEAENSSEKSEESFESWFNAVYRKYATVETSSEASTTNTQESEEIEQNENVDDSNENNSHNEYDESDWGTTEVNQKPAELNSEENNEDDNNNNDYDTFFVPTTMDPTQRDVSVEYLVNDGKYLYSTEDNLNYDEISVGTKLSCIRSAESLESYIECLKRYVEQQDERKNFVSVEIENKSDSVGSDENGSAASNSKESEEGATTDSSETQESAETEQATTDSSESQESGETEGTTTDSSESQESAETEESTTDSNESHESRETEEATTNSSESQESGETEGASTDSSESQESPEGLWYDYNDYSLI